LERGILSALPLKVTELEFADVLDLAFRMLWWSFVPVRVVAAGVLAIAKASGYDGALIDAPVPRSLAGSTHCWNRQRILAVKAFLAELEGRKLRPEEVPGRVNDQRTIGSVDALRRDDPSGLKWGGGLDPRTLLELGIDIMPLLTSGLTWCVLAVELNARDCALVLARDAHRHARATGAALEALLLEAVGYPDELREFQVAHGTSLAMTLSVGEEANAWDAELALALYEEGLEQSLARVGEPPHASSWWYFATDATPAKRRKLLKSTKHPPERLELFEIAWREPELVMKWLVDNSDRVLSWSDLGSAVDWSTQLSWTQSFAGVDLAKAARVLEQLDFPRPFSEEVMKALLDAGLDDLAEELEAKLPPGCVDPRCCY
jgi:hypothetical protein